MKRELYFRELGFTLIELLVVVAILGILSALIVPNIAGFIGEGQPVIKEPAVYTIYISENGQQKEIGTLDIGEVCIWSPKRMSLNGSDIVKLHLVPSENITDTINFTEDNTSKPSSTYYQVTESIELYPIMSAILSSANFNISSQASGYKNRVINFDSTTEWIWNISPLASGEQILNAELYAPVNVDGFEDMAVVAIYNRSLVVLVKGQFDLDTFFIGIGSFSGLIIALIAIAKLIPRKRKKADIEDIHKEHLNA